MAMRLIGTAMAQERDGHAFRQSLQQPKRKLLAMIFYRVVSLIDGAALDQFLPILPAELTPMNGPGLECPQQLFARAEVCHPDVILRPRQAAATKSRRQNPQAIFVGLDRRKN